MSQNKRTLAVLLSAVMVLGVAAPAVAGTAAAASNTSLSVSVTQDSTGEATVTVTDNGTAADGASVTVETLDDNVTYDGAGTYTADANGTVALPAPNQTVNVSVTASFDNATASTEATLTASTTEDDDGNATNFGQRVSTFVADLQASNNTSGPLGAQVASFVVENNPGNPPAHAGPPAWLTNDSVNKTTGPPAHAGPPDDNKTRGPPNSSGGPPDDAGPPNGTDRGPPNSSGPPDDAGPPNGTDKGNNGNNGNGNNGKN